MGQGSSKQKETVPANGAWHAEKKKNTHKGPIKKRVDRLRRNKTTFYNVKPLKSVSYANVLPNEA